MERVVERRKAVARTQGAVWVVSGLWPVVHLPSFMAITGPKTDRWLVKTVGLMITAVGTGLLMASQRNDVSPEMETVAIGSALSLAAIDLMYVPKRRISPVYLLDAIMELGFVYLWRRARR